MCMSIQKFFIDFLINEYHVAEKRKKERKKGKQKKCDLKYSRICQNDNVRRT